MSNIIDFTAERQKRRPGETLDPLDTWRLTHVAYRYHYQRVHELGEQLGLKPEKPSAELGRLAMRVCDLVLASRDTTGEEHQRLVDESSTAIQAYEELRDVKQND